MGARSRRKGVAWERTVAALLSEATGLDYQRVLTESRDGNVGDVDADGGALSVQCKIGARPNPYQALREAVEAAGASGRLPVAVLRKNGSGSRPPEDLAVLRIEDFVALIGR